MRDLRPPNLRDPFTVAFLVVAGFVFGVVAYVALHAPGAGTGP